MKSRTIAIENQMIGIIGIDEVFAQLFKAGKGPSIELRNELLEKLREHNYIPVSKEEIIAHGSFIGPLDKT